MKRFTLVLLLTVALSGCIMPAWHSPVQDFSLECQGDLDTGECSKRLAPGWGDL